MDHKVSSSIKCSPLDANITISARVILDTSKLKTVITCAPAKIGGGFKVDCSGKTKLKGKTSGEANIKDKILHGGVSGLFGVSGGGTIHGGGFALYDDKVVDADGQISGAATFLGKSAFNGDVGVGKDGKGILSVYKRLAGTGKYSEEAFASVSVATDEDAEAFVQAYEGTNTLGDGESNKSTETALMG